MDLSAQSVEEVAAIGFVDGGSMSAGSTAAEARSQREVSCTVPISVDGLVLGNLSGRSG